MRDKLGGSDEMHGVHGDDAGYENKVLDLMEKKTSSLGGAHLMGDSVQIVGDDVQIVAGPKVNFATLGADAPLKHRGRRRGGKGKLHRVAGDDVQIVAGPKVNFATLGEGSLLGGDSASDITAAAIVVPLAAFAGYGIYKAAGGGSSSPNSGGGSKPWLYKLNPSYWFKSDREKRFTRAAKEGTYYDGEKARELELAKHAYDVTEGVRTKEAQLEQLDQAISNPNAAPVASAAPAAAATATSGDDAPPAGYPPAARAGGKGGPAGYPLPGKSPNLDKKILKTLSKAGYPIAQGSTWNKDKTSATKAVEVVRSAMGGQGDPAQWLLAFFERQGIAFQGDSGKMYEVHGGRLVMAAPNAGSDVSLTTQKGAKPTAALPSVSSGWGSSPWEKSLGYSTSFRTADTTMMPTTGARRRTNVKGQFIGYAPSPWEKTLGFNTAVSLVNSTAMPTTGARKKSTAVKGWGRSPWEKGLATTTAFTMAYPTMMPTTGARRKGNVSVHGEFIGADGHPHKHHGKHARKHGKPKTTLVGYSSNPWGTSLVDATVMSTIDPTFMPTTGGARFSRRSSMKGWGSTPWEKSLGYSTSFRTAMPTIMPTTGARKRSTAVKGWGSTPWEKSLGYSTSFRTAMPTIMPTTGARRRGNVVRGDTLVGYGSSPWEKGLVDSTVFSTIDPTFMPTTGARRGGRRSSMKGTFIGYTPRLNVLGADVTYFDGPGIAAGTTTSVVPTIAPAYPTTYPAYPGYPGYPTDPYAQQPAPYTDPYASAAPYSVPYSPSTSYAPPAGQGQGQGQGQYGRRRRRHHPHRRQQGQQAAQQSSLVPYSGVPISSLWRGSPPPIVSGAFIGGTGAFVGAGPTPAQMAASQTAVLANMAKFQNANIQQIASLAGLKGKKQWSSADVDKVAAGLLQKMMTQTKVVPDANHANIARNVTRAWTKLVGVTVVGGEFVGGTDSMGGIGSFLKTVAKVAVTPVAAAFWGVGKAVQGAGWVVQKGGQGLAWAGGKTLGKMWGGGGGAPAQPGMPPGMMPPGAVPGMVPYAGPTGMSPQQMQMYQQLAARKAAASARILAAENAQESALTQQQQAQDLQDAQYQAQEAEDAASTAEKVAMQAQASANLPQTPQALIDAGISGMGGWADLRKVPRHYVGANAAAATKNDEQGKQLRKGASIARASKRNPKLAKHVKKVEVAAKNGNPKAQHQDAIIKAGALADHQRLDAFHKDAVVKRRRADLAHAVFRRLLKVGGAPTGAFAKWNPLKSGIVTVGADAPAKAKSKIVAGNFPPPIPGVPADVIVALTAASNTFGVPPMVAASVVAAARSGDPKAKKELLDASKVYKAAQMGDPSAKRQMATVISDMKTGYGPAAEKAAVMAAAVGTTKGTKNAALRKKVRAKLDQQYAATAPQVIPDSVWPASFFKIISYGTGPL